MISSTHLQRVPYSDTDQGGVVHHTAYLRYLEAARIEFMRERGLIYRDFEAQRHLALAVVQANLNYRRPARFDDELQIQTRIGLATYAKLRIDSTILRAGECLLEAQILLACVDLRVMRPMALPDDLRKALGIAEVFK